MTNHKDLPAAELHEAKQIKTATAAQAGQVITPSSVDNEGELRNLFLDEITHQNKRFGATGWATYQDNTYTFGSPLAITASTRTKLTIDGAGSGSTSTYRADGDAEYWNTGTNKITPEVIGDAFNVRLSFIAATAVALPVYFDVELDVGGASGTIVADTRSLTVSGSAANPIVFSWPVYALSDFVTNGGELYLTASADIEIYNLELFIAKSHQQG